VADPDQAFVGESSQIRGRQKVFTCSLV